MASFEPVYSTRFASEQLALNATGATHTVPSDHVWVINDVQTRQNPGTSVQVYLRDASIGETVILTIMAGTGSGTSWTGRVVCPGGSQLHWTASGAAANITWCGFDFTNP